MSRRVKETPNPVDAWMPLWIGDYLGDTLGLTTEQHGAYLLLLMAYWRNRGPLDDDDEAFTGITRLSAERWAVQRPRIARFFHVEDGLWRHKRVDEERVAAEERSGKAHTRAKNAAAARWGREDASAGPEQIPSTPSGNASSMPQALLEQCPSPSPSPSPAVTATAGEASPPPAPGKPARAKKPQTPIVIPDWLPADVWDLWYRFRNSGKGWTHDAKLLSLRTLTTLHTAGHNPRVVVEQSVERGWTGLFPPKEHVNGSSPSRPHPSPSPADRVLRHITERAADDPGQRSRD